MCFPICFARIPRCSPPSPRSRQPGALPFLAFAKSLPRRVSAAALGSWLFLLRLPASHALSSIFVDSLHISEKSPAYWLPSDLDIFYHIIHLMFFCDLSLKQIAFHFRFVFFFSKSNNTSHSVLIIVYLQYLTPFLYPDPILCELTVLSWPDCQSPFHFAQSFKPSIRKLFTFTLSLSLSDRKKVLS